VDPKGVRARYDMAILNPDFIENKDKKRNTLSKGLAG